MKITTIIPTPTWGKTLELFQSKGSIKLLESDSEKFKSILDAAGLSYETETIKGEKEMVFTKFTLKKAS
jgi:hypothetical protein